MNSKAEEFCAIVFCLFLIGRGEVIIDGDVQCPLTMQVTVHLIDGISDGNVVLNDSGEVIEDAVSIDTCSIVGAVAVVTGTEGTAQAYEVVTGLHAFNSLIHIASSVPGLNAHNILAVFILDCAISVAPGTSPIFCILLGEVAIGNQPANVSAGNIILGNGMFQPLVNTLNLGLDFLCGSGMLFDDIFVGAERIVLAGFVILREISFERCTKVTRESLVILEECLHLFALVNIGLIYRCVLLNGSLHSIKSIVSVSKANNSSCTTQSRSYGLPFVKQCLSGNDAFFCLSLLVRLNHRSNALNVFIFRGSEVLFCTINNYTLCGGWQRILISTDSLIPNGITELTAVCLPCKGTGCNLFLR